MCNFISGFCFTRADMLRMCFGLVFVGLAVAAHTAQSEEGYFAPELEILTIQPTHSVTDWLLPHRLNVSVVLTRFTRLDDTAVRSEFSNTPRLHHVDDPKKEIDWLTNARWQVVPNSDHVSLSPVLRFESKGERIEIKPQRHSVQITWRKAFP